ncbi:MAG: Bd3614 family nucleic acid deaminase, partial [Gammaproteobacteria bacterium]
NTQETFADVLAELKQLCPSEQTFLTTIEANKIELEMLQENCIQTSENIGHNYQEILLESTDVLKQIFLGIHAYHYLTQGEGQYEEYDSSDPDYDPIAAQRFGRTLRLAQFAYAIEEYSNYLNPEDFVESISILSKKIKLLIKKPIDLEDDAFCEEVKGMLNSLHTDIEEVCGCFSALVDSKDMGRKTSLEDRQEIESISAAEEQMMTFQSEILQLYNQFSRLSRNLEKYREEKQQAEELHDNFHQFTKKFITSVSHMSAQAIRKSADKIADNAKNSIIENKNIIIEKLELLRKIVFRDYLLAQKTPSSALLQLTQRLEGKKQEIITVYENAEEKVTLPLLSVFIEYLVIEDAIHELEKKKAEKFNTVFHSAQANIDPQSNHALVHVQNSGIIYGVKGNTESRGVNSHLAMLVHYLHTQHVKPSAYEAILLLRGNVNTPLTRYERGLLSVLEISIEGKVLASPIYEKMSALIAMQQTPVTQLPITWVQPNFYHGYADLEHLRQKVYGAAPQLAEFSEEIEEFYMQFTMYLVAKFCNGSKRSVFKMEDGYPVVCLIVAADGEILSWGVNTGIDDRTRHAEINALYLYFMRNPNANSLPQNVRIFSSLKSCCMCAGGIADCLENFNSSKVIYGQTDPGQLTTDIEPIEYPSTNTLFIELDEDYKQLKAAQSGQKGATSNAAASFNNLNLKKHVSAIRREFVEKVLARPAHLSAVIDHMYSFTQAHQLITQTPVKPITVKKTNLQHWALKKASPKIRQPQASPPSKRSAKK